MAVDKVQVHRPGPYKQSNKEHKHGRHRSKGSISVATKGTYTSFHRFLMVTFYCNF